MKNIINYLLIVILFLLIVYGYEVEQLENKLDTIQDKLHDTIYLQVANKNLYVGENFPKLIVSTTKHKWNIIKEDDNIILKLKNTKKSNYNYYYLEHSNDTLQLSIYKNGPNKLFKIIKHNNGFYIKVPNKDKFLFVKNNTVILSSNKTLFQN